jgi:hypothetical protein
MDIARVDVADAIKTLPHIFAIMILSFIIPVYFLASLFSKPKTPKVEKKKSEGSPKKEESKGKSTAVDSPKATKRTTKKD